MFKNNKIYSVDKNNKMRRIFWKRGLKITFKGKDNVVIIGYKCRFKNSSIMLGNNTKVEFDSRAAITGLRIASEGNNCRCKIGERFGVTRNCIISYGKEDNLNISIGDNCMLASNIAIRASDRHSVIDLNTGNTINPGADISIGNHVWICSNVSVLKGVKIAENSIIGIGSLVSKNCDIPNCLYAGSPATVKKTGVTWDSKSPNE